MITGYSGTGKDTFYKSIIGQNTLLWECYSNEYYKPNDPKAIRFALADELKILVAKKLGIQYDIEIEKNKDKKMFDGNTKSFRDYLIEYSLKKRLKDPDYFCKLLIKKINEIPIINNSSDILGSNNNGIDISTKTESNINIYITDWRFKNELDFFKKNFNNVKTIRIARLGIEKINIASENSLDQFETDILVIPEKQDLIETCKYLNLYLN